MSIDNKELCINENDEELCFIHGKIIRKYLSNFYKNIELPFNLLYNNDFDICKSINEKNIFYYYPELFNKNDVILYTKLVDKYSNIISKNLLSIELKNILEENDITIIYSVIKDYPDINPLFIIDEYNKLITEKKIKNKMIEKIQELYDYYNELNKDFEKTIMKNYNNILLKNGFITKELWINFLLDTIKLYWKYALLLLDKDIIGIKEFFYAIDEKISITDYINCIFKENYTIL